MVPNFLIQLNCEPERRRSACWRWSTVSPVGLRARAGRAWRCGSVAGAGLAGALAVAGERALDGGGEEAGEQRVRVVRPRAELRVKLRAANASRVGTSSSVCVLGLGYVLILGIYLPPARSSRGSWQFPSHGDG